jgi:hypothetical protein
MHPEATITGVEWRGLMTKHDSKIAGDDDNHKETPEATLL